MKFFTSADTRRRSLGLVTVVTLALGGTYVGLRQAGLIGLHPAALRDWIASFGVFAPIVFILVQTVQVIVAPIPGHLTALLGGYLFGPIVGTAYSLIGLVIGSVIAFGLSKRYGRPYVERLLHPDIIERFDGFVDTVGLPGLFVVVLIPGLPDDAVCLLGGLTRIRVATFLGIMTLERLPEIVLLTVAGEGLATGRLTQVGLILGSIAVLSLIVYLKRDTLLRWLPQR